MMTLHDRFHPLVNFPHFSQFNQPASHPEFRKFAHFAWQIVWVYLVLHADSSKTNSGPGAEFYKSNNDSETSNCEPLNEAVTKPMKRTIRFNETPEDTASRLLELSKELREAAAEIIAEQERAKPEEGGEATAGTPH